jgi:Zn-dependent M28 family amino/carboxypeptidase
VRRPALTLGLALVGGCGGEAGDAADADGGAASDAARAVDATPCAAPATPAWLGDYEAEVLAKLAGAAEIAPDVTLTARASEGERAIVRAYLEEELARWGYATALDAYATGANVVAALPPTEAAADPPLVILGAHFDGVLATPAAADDGTGTALVVAAARHLAAAPCRRAEVRFVWFDEEELGLIGSKAFVAGLAADAGRLRAAHLFDMISWDADRDGAVELWSGSEAVLAGWRAAAAAAGAPLREVEFEFSDHQSFVDAGLPTVGVSEEFVSGDHTPHYHEPTDTFANVDLAYLEAVTALAFAVVGADVVAP